MKERSGAVAHADHASAPLLFDHLRIGQRWPRHPAGLGRGACGLAARRLDPLAEMREPGGGILVEPVRQKQRHTAWSRYLPNPVDRGWRHGLGALADVDRQQQFGDRVDRAPDPGGGT
jgi:hypothetical protein